MEVVSIKFDANASRRRLSVGGIIDPLVILPSQTKTMRPGDGLIFRQQVHK